MFTQAEWLWNERLAEELQARNLDVILPQRSAEPMLKSPASFNPQSLFDGNVRDIKSADVIVAIFDGADADSGTCWECGFAYGLPRPIIGVRTDIRAGGDDLDAKINLMLSKCCTAIVSVPGYERRNIGWVADQLAQAIRKAVGMK